MTHNLPQPVLVADIRGLEADRAEPRGVIREPEKLVTLGLYDVSETKAGCQARQKRLNEAPSDIN